MENVYCPMIQAGLNINLNHDHGKLVYNQCCLSTSDLQEVADVPNLWNSEYLKTIRDQNNKNIWNKGCWECQNLEAAGLRSFRQAMIDKFGYKKDISGPQRIDLLFDRNCNLACMTCGPGNSTLWYKHLKENNFPIKKYPTVNNLETILSVLKSLDLKNLEMVQFCGGETLLGNTYWETANLIAEIAPYPKKITLGFQTNGTQNIDKKYYKIIEKFHLVKILVSIDGIGDKFEYLRWPASWNQVQDNIMQLRENLPVNVMFFVQETTSCLNLFYLNQVSDWVKTNFNANRLGDPTEHSTQLAIHDYLHVNNITQEYYNIIKNTEKINLLNSRWTENPESIKLLIKNLNTLDQMRKHDWKQVFPEVASFYSRYI